MYDPGMFYQVERSLAKMRHVSGGCEWTRIKHLWDASQNLRCSFSRVCRAAPNMGKLSEKRLSRFTVSGWSREPFGERSPVSNIGDGLSRWKPRGVAVPIV